MKHFWGSRVRSIGARRGAWMTLFGVIIGLLVYLLSASDQRSAAPAPRAKALGAVASSSLSVVSHESERSEPPAGESMNSEAESPLAFRLRERGATVSVPGAAVDVYLHGEHATRLFSDANGIVVTGDLGQQEGEFIVTSPEHMVRRASTADVVSNVVDGLPTLWLDPVGVLEVQVIDEFGAPLRGVFVEVFPEDRSKLLSGSLMTLWPDFQPPGRMTTDVATHLLIPSETDDSGHVRIPYMPCNVPLTVRATWNVPESTAKCLISPEDRRAQVTIRVAEFAQLSGSLFWSDGTPAYGVSVTLFAGHNSTMARDSVVDQDGRFRFDRVPVGWVEWRPDLEGERARGLSVAAPATEAERVVLLARTRVRGQVVARSASELPGPYFLKWKCGEAHVVSAVTTTDGKFSLWAPNERATVAVHRAVGLPVIAEFEVEDPTKFVEFDVSHSLAAFKFTPRGIPPGTPVRVGYCYVDGEDALIGVPTIHATNDQSRALDPRIGSIGWSDESILATALAPGAVSIWFECSEVGGGRFPLTQLVAAQLVDLGEVSIGWGSVEVEVVDETGAPVPGLALAVYRVGTGAGGESAARTLTSHAGVARFTDLCPGDYFVAACSAPGRWRTPESVVVDSGAETTLTLTVARTGRIVGRVLTPERWRDDVASKSVSQLLARLTGIGDAGGSDAQLTVVVSGEGEFAFDSVPAGEYQVRIQGPNVNVGRRTRVAAGADASLEFDLKRSGRNVTFLWDGRPDSAAVQARLVTCLGTFVLTPTGSTGRFELPWGPTRGVFVVSRRGVPGAGYAGHPRLTVRQTAAVAVCNDRAESADMTVELAECVARVAVGKSDQPAPHVRVIGSVDCPELEAHALPESLQVVPGDGGWTCHVLSPGLVLEITEGIGELALSRRLIVRPQ